MNHHIHTHTQNKYSSSSNLYDPYHDDNLYDPYHDDD